jgi:hypothetical protein
MQKIGEVAFVQIQTEPLKTGESGNRLYSPQHILRVPRLRLTSEGVFGMLDDGEQVMDVHHPQHPKTRNRGDNGVSFGFLPYYAEMRERFGHHLEDGMAGENILIEMGHLPVEAPRLLVIEDSVGQRCYLRQITPAPPCKPFSFFCLRRHVEAQEMKATLQWLDGGRRGYYAAPEIDEFQAMIQAGDGVFMA